MGWHVSLLHPTARSLPDEDGDTWRLPVTVPTFIYGSTYAIGGTGRASVSITYNYGWYFRHLHHQRLDWLRGRFGADTSLPLGRAVQACMAEPWPPPEYEHYDPLTETYADLRGRKLTAAVMYDQDRASYWDATPHNAAAALRLLYLWALLNPDAEWEVT